MIVHINKLIKEKNRYKNYPISSQILFRQKQLNKNKYLSENNFIVQNNTKLKMKENFFYHLNVKY